MTEPTILTVRQILGHFRATLETARRTGEPVIIALRGRQPAGVLLGYEAWEAGRAELAAERRRGATLAAELAEAQRQVEDMSRDLAVTRQRVAELEAQLARPQSSDLSGVGWGVTPQPEPPALPLGAWASQPWGGSNAEKLSAAR